MMPAKPPCVQCPQPGLDCLNYRASSFVGKFEGMTMSPFAIALEPHSSLYGMYMPGQPRNNGHVNDPKIAAMLPEGAPEVGSLLRLGGRGPCSTAPEERLCRRGPPSVCRDCAQGRVLWTCYLLLSRAPTTTRSGA
jgi:hypothetical protein